MKNKFFYIVITAASIISCGPKDEDSNLNWMTGSMGFNRIGHPGHEYLTEYAMEGAVAKMFEKGFTKQVFPTDLSVVDGFNSTNPVIRGNYLTDNPRHRQGNEPDLVSFFGVDAPTDWHQDPRTQSAHFLRAVTNPSRGIAEPKSKACQAGKERIITATLEARRNWASNRDLALVYIGHATHIIQDSFSPAHVRRGGDSLRKITDICTYGTKVGDGCYHDTISFDGDPTIADDYVWGCSRKEYLCLKQEAKTAVNVTEAYLVVVGTAMEKSETDTGIRRNLDVFFGDSSQNGMGYFECSGL